ncbi:MAG: transcriptional regulator [Terracidiphilus sp.]
MIRVRVFRGSHRRTGLCFLAGLATLLLAGIPGWAQAYWSAVGPAGGDARAFAAVPGNPSHLYLGTTDSWLYESIDAGVSWRRLAKLDPSDDLVLDHIVVDPTNHSTIYIAAWRLDATGGGLWISRDAGRNWTAVEALRGQSIRTFAMAPSNPHLLFTGSLEGVFRSSDSGAHWTLISPAGSREIHEVESLAIDPTDPNIVYAGTWHLPWKTTDGGQNWKNVKQGLIDDSDVFSIVVDPVEPSTVFLSACSGIYKSESAAELFHKIQGIPSTARRTRVLKQDPANHLTVYAGTTEGLYKTVDGGKTFQPMTDPDVIVNDVFVDPSDPQHVLLATDRGGVLVSHDGAVNFTPANRGFSERKVEALVVDRANPARLYAGVVNDKSLGGVFVSADAGQSWEQIEDGLDERDVYALGQSPDGVLMAGTNHGLFVLGPPTKDAPAGYWLPRNTMQNSLIRKTTVLKKGKKVQVDTVVKGKPSILDGRVYALDISGDAWLASTSAGLLTSSDKGATWQGGLVAGSGEYITVAAHGAQMAGARLDAMVVSSDAGQTWTPVAIPNQITRVHRLAFSADGTLWLATREGVFFTHDLAKSWLSLERMPFRDVSDLYYDAATNRVLTSSRQSDWVYAIDPASLTWKWWQTGYRLFLIRAVQGRLVAASIYDGVLVEPPPATASAGQR